MKPRDVTIGIDPGEADEPCEKCGGDGYYELPEDEYTVVTQGGPCDCPAGDLARMEYEAKIADLPDWWKA